jgi:hypothetical protein
MSKMTEQQDADALRFVQGKWGSRPCPMCGGQGWGFPDTLANIPDIVDVRTSEGLRVRAVLPITCLNCGLVLPVSATVAGIIPRE